MLWLFLHIGITWFVDVLDQLSDSLIVSFSSGSVAKQRRDVLCAIHSYPGYSSENIGIRDTPRTKLLFRKRRLLPPMVVKGNQLSCNLLCLEYFQELYDHR